MAQQERARSTRQAIIDAAARIFEDHGYGGTSLANVAVEAQVTKGALYFHFPAKNVLAAAVIAAQHAMAAEDGERVLAQRWPPLETMILISRGFAVQLVGHSVMRAGIRLTFEASAFGHDVRQPYLDWAATFDELTREAQQDGVIAADVDTAAFARLMVGAYTGVQMVSGILTGRADVLERLADLWRTVLPGILAADQREDAGRLVELFLDGPAT